MDEYRKKVDSIRAPEALINATLNKIHEEEAKEPSAAAQPSAVIEPFKPRRRWISISAVAAAAAVLAVVIGLNVNAAQLKLNYGTFHDTLLRANFPADSTRQMELQEYSALIGMDVAALIPGADIVKSDIKVEVEKDFILSDECALTCNANGKPLILLLSGTHDVIPEALTQFSPSQVYGLTVYAAESDSGRTRVAGFRAEGFSFLLSGTDMECEEFEALLIELIKNIQK